MKTPFTRFVALFALTGLAISGCSRETAPTKPSAELQHKEASVSQSAFGTTPEGENVELFTFSNAQGLEARIISYGGIAISLRVPDRDGRLDDIALGYDNLDGYLKSTPYFGAIIGRYGNRIAKGRFTLDGKTYQLQPTMRPITSTVVGKVSTRLSGRVSRSKMPMQPVWFSGARVRMERKATRGSSRSPSHIR